MATSTAGVGEGSPLRQTPTNATTNDGDGQTRTRSSTQSSGRLRSASLKFLESSPPSGMWHATGNALAQTPTPMEIRRGDFGRDGWDGPLQRRNSNISEESAQKLSLSRQTSAQTPISLTRTKTNTLPVHTEADESGPSVAKVEPEASRTTFTPRPQATTVEPHTPDPQDDEDPFSMFVGRGRIQSQVYEPKSTSKEKQIEQGSDPTMDDADETDSLDDLDPRPKKRLSALPRKFIDPTGEDVPKPDEKLKDIGSKTKSPSPPTAPRDGPDVDGIYPNGYKFPPKHSWGEATKIGLKGFWKFTLTPLGFLIVVYGLNVVAWGGMLFLLLIGGGQAYMCFPPNKPPGYKDCGDLYSPRRVWIEIDSQILNALFCVTGFGLVPWRFRDLYYLLQYRLRHQQSALRRLAGIHRAWFRLPGSQDLPPEPAAQTADADADADANPSIPLPVNKIPDPPLTGVRAPATKLWKLDYVIWAYVFNTFLQVVLSVFMWSMNRFDRPSWSTGLFVALACIVAALGGLMAFLEGKKIKAVEGIPVGEARVLVDAEKLVLQRELGGRTRLKKNKENKKKKRRHITKVFQGFG